LANLSNDEVRAIAREDDDAEARGLLAFLESPEIGDYFFSQSRQTTYWHRYDGEGWIAYPSAGTGEC
jgi:hypothetical protein